MAVFLVATLCLLGVTPALAQIVSVEDYPDVMDARVSATAERARLIIDLSGPTEFAIATLDNPNRIAIDVKAFEVKILAPADVAGDGLVSSYSVEMAEKGRARTLLTLAKPALVQQAYMMEAVADQPARLVVDLIPTDEMTFNAKVAADLAASVANQGAVPETTSTDPGTHAAPVAETRPLVVLDPGHGGIDNGASAPNGVHEKDITLTFALQLQKVLMETGHFDVALTREDDAYLTLNQRVDLARQNKADLFISLHADSFQEPEIRGASVYTRDENATDVLDKVLADGENRYDIVAGFALPQATPAVMDILVDLMRREMRKSSFLAAEAIVHQLEPSVALRRFPVRQADFFVLQAPDVPSVLVELGFLSNAADIANLQQSDWRDRVVNALARGIADYFDQTQKSAAVAP
ncbi:N-acetylmuramoyl-L-alanine amidase [Devosia sp. ZB163]|uniref:N-acetylmuramoyl-L-alanine amidase n=1 Tax=Devosia sp. ZB163 TaxID=3025938 RepID=UPI00235E1A91|nr:N-acetylmuramoyl-L-alanine amidase [Devosia sp. ZB163]MDC9824790.1 N-acetylmuramoyl-L-alanine amidase [Devosia sp. ZB163]